ncbi:MAG TPA: hypothetical protein VFC00_22935 [Micromonosporaceae bacterium]|nr:hypothetical protein [Micromonosporaceae bacterium]
MAGPDRVEWRRGFPSRALSALGWYIGLGSITIVITFILFGSEPETLESGRANPLAAVPGATIVLGVVFAVPLLLALIRRPTVAADHYGLTLRPGILRTLLLPWAHVEEVTAFGFREDPFLLVRCGGQRDPLGDSPRWFDRFVLRAAARASRNQRGSKPIVLAYDVAVRMAEFVGSPDTQLASLASVVPDHVILTNELS